MSRLGTLTVLFSFGLLTWLACDQGPTEPQAQPEVTQQLARKGPKVSEVAFFASLSNNIPLPANSVHQVSFENVLLNLGDAYDPATGVFTAPTDGVYQLEAHTAIGGLYWARLSKNGSSWIYTSVVQAGVLNSYHATNANGSSVTVPLLQGDAIAVEVSSSSSEQFLRGASEVEGVHITYFSGHLVAAQ